MQYIFPPYIGPKLRKFHDGSVEDPWKTRRDPVYNEVCYAPLSEASSLRDINNYEWPNPDWYDYSKIPDMCRKYNDCSVVIYGGNCGMTTVLYQGINLCGMEKMMADLALNPDFVQEMFERITGFYLEVNKRIFEAAKGEIDSILMGDDFGTQRGLLISPAMLKRFVFPNLKKQFDLAHRYNIKVMFHSCGAISEIIPDLTSLGVDVLNPVNIEFEKVLVYK
ncbi:MAG: hypothetical protein JW983_00605 [Elusimicrobia bacterium]|nr:hypothetical protein [Elusimicrobiota bacterium]